MRLNLLNYLSIRLKSGYCFGNIFSLPNVGKGRKIKYKEEKLGLKEKYLSKFHLWKVSLQCII